MPPELVQPSEQALLQLAINHDAEVSNWIFPKTSDVAEIAGLIASISTYNISPDVIAITNMSLTLSSETSIQTLMRYFAAICAIGRQPKFDPQNPESLYNEKYFVAGTGYPQYSAEFIIVDPLIETILDETRKVICNQKLVLGLGGGAATLLHSAVSAKLAMLLSLSALGCAFGATIGLAIVGLVSAGTICTKINQHFMERLMAEALVCRKDP
jgi:hypothetical protein